MDLGGILNGEEQTVECLLRTDSSDGSKSAFSFLRIFVMYGFANSFTIPGGFGKRRGFDHVKNFRSASTFFLNAISIPVENFEDGQRLQFLGKLARHVQRRRKGHHGVKSDIIFSAKGAGICKG